MTQIQRQWFAQIQRQWFAQIQSQWLTQIQILDVVPAGEFALEYETVAVILLPQLRLLDEGGGDVLAGRPHLPKRFDGSKPGHSFPKT